MRKTFLAVAALSATCLLPDAPAAARPAAQPHEESRLTVLYDAFGRRPGLEKDWGFAAFIEHDGRRILFDTGNDPSILERNVRAARVDLSDLDFAVVSHRHGDHTSGLRHVIEVAPDLPVYAPRENFGVFGAELPGSFYRRDDSLPAAMRYFDGHAPETLRFGSAWPAGDFRLVSETTEIVPGIHLIALPGPWGVDLEVVELTLAVETPEGIVLIVGCSHPTIERIVAAAAAATGRPVSLVIGGFHLLPAEREEVRRVALALRDDLGVERIAPAHCTGEHAFAVLREVFGDGYVYAGLGEKFVFASSR